MKHFETEKRIKLPGSNRNSTSCPGHLTLVLITFLKQHTPRLCLIPYETCNDSTDYTTARCSSGLHSKYEYNNINGVENVVNTKSKESIICVSNLFLQSDLHKCPRARAVSVLAFYKTAKDILNTPQRLN